MSGTVGTVGFTASSPYYNPGQQFDTGTGQIIGGLTPGPVSPSNPASGAPPIAPSPSGGGGGGGGGMSLRDQMLKGLIPWDDNKLNSGGAPDYSAQMRNDINSGYDSYFGSLNDMLNNGLPSQRTAQEGIVNSQYDQGVNSLDTQKTLGMQDLGKQQTQADTQQAKTLQDLSDNIRNLFQSGNVYLGARGAADSSAADQYSYALTKMGSKQRGDVTSQYAQIHNDINDRQSRLSEIYNGQVKDLMSQRDQKLSGIAQWFAEQQNALKQAQAQGQLQRGQDLASLSQNLLNASLQRLQQVQAESANQRSLLDQWAANHSNDINQLRQNLQSVSSTNYAMPQSTPLAGAPQVSPGGNMSLFGFGNQDTKNTNLFGQPLA